MRWEYSVVDCRKSREGGAEACAGVVDVNARGRAMAAAATPIADFLAKRLNAARILLKLKTLPVQYYYKFIL
jgi:hypothetical protein